MSKKNKYKSILITIRKYGLELKIKIIPNELGLNNLRAKCN